MRTNLLGLLSLRELRRRGRPAHDHQGWQIANYSGRAPNFTEKYMERFVILRKSWLKITDGTFARVECHVWYRNLQRDFSFLKLLVFLG